MTTSSTNRNRTYFNLWRGFAYTPWPDSEPVPPNFQRALDAFLEHARENVCRGSVEHYKWLIGFFAHLVQKPAEKPLVALVFRGDKGVGKNALVERVGELLGCHFVVTSDKRYLVGNFNGHLENLLFICFDEAFWSGDKVSEGNLKHLITGKEHMIEHKGKAPYPVRNLTRVCIIGNEDWLVPASHDERRFAVFDVGDGRKQDRAFFKDMRVSMEEGGYRVLLRFLQNFPLDDFDPNGAPATSALLEQKHASLAPEQEWWLESLTQGNIAGSEFGDTWPDYVPAQRLREALARWAKGRNIRTRIPTASSLGRNLRKLVPGIRHKKKSYNAGYDYVLPTLVDCRHAWDKFIGHAEEWDDDDDEQKDDAAA